MEGLQAFEPFAFSLCDVRLSDAGVIVCKCEEVPLSSKAYGRYRAHKVCVNILIRLCCPLLRCSIILLYGFCLFAAIAHVTFSVINRDDVVMSKMPS